LIEEVQRMATKLVVGMKGMGFEERLQFLDMTTLKTRRIRGDLIEMFKILKGIEDLKEKRFFTMDKGCTSQWRIQGGGMGGIHPPPPASNTGASEEVCM
jgi:hypothetical protein